MTDLEITYRSPAELHENPRNVRTHSARQIRQIARSITVFGFANLDLSRFFAAPSARLGHFAFECDGAFPGQC